MEVFQTRLDSFSKSIRVKAPTGKSYASLKWPHPNQFQANPTSLAEAGFYFSPSWDDRDNVACFMCSKQLSDWDEMDDPFETHWSKCRTKCSWAVVRCGSRDNLDEEGNYVFSSSSRLPSSKIMEKARLETFSKRCQWPHDSSKSHGAHSKKMACAGFVYTPQTLGDDTATCLYCGISLSGWDEGDDPMAEHRKRRKKSGRACPFFFTNTVPDSNISSKPPSLETSKSPSRAVKRSKSRKAIDTEASGSEAEQPGAEFDARRNQLLTRAASVAPSVEADPDRALRRSTRNALGSSSMSTLKIQEEVGTGEAKKGVLRGGKRKARGKTKEPIDAIEEDVEIANVDRPKKGRGTAKVRPDDSLLSAIESRSSDGKAEKSIRARKTKQTIKDTGATSVEDLDGESVTDSKTESTAKRRKKTTHSVCKITEESDVEPPVSPRTLKSTTRSKSRARLLSDSEAPPTAVPKARARKKLESVIVETKDANPQSPKPSKANHSPAKQTSRPDTQPPILASENKEQPSIPPTEQSVVSNTSDEQTVQILSLSGPNVRSMPSKKRSPKRHVQEDGDEGSHPAKHLSLQMDAEVDVGIELDLCDVSMLPLPLAPEQLDSPMRVEAAPSPQLNAALTEFDSVAISIPPLAVLPLHELSSLTVAELDMTVEQWIRFQMAAQYELLAGDGKKAIDTFKGRAQSGTDLIYSL